VSVASTNATISPPEPDLTPEEMLARGRGLRSRLIEEQAATEERRYYSQEMHEEFVKAGFYRLYIPRRFGGYEFDVPTYVRLISEIARGCPSTAWCLGLALNHALQIGSWWDEDAQAAIFGDGDFRAASVAAPIGVAERVDEGWKLTGKVSYCSGIPYSTHYMGQALMPGFDPTSQELPQMLLFVAPKGVWTMLDDWGHLMGLKGSGSHSIVFEGGTIPANWGLENTIMVDVSVENGTPGYALHGNPMYSGRALSIFTISIAAVMVGAAWNALDEYVDQANTRGTPLPPMGPRRLDPDYQRYIGSGVAKISTAEAALLNAAEQHMEACERNVAGEPYTYYEDHRIASIAREVMIMTWEVVESELARTIGSSPFGEGERFERIYRDMTIGQTHRNPALRDWAFGEIGRGHLGLPRDFLVQNVQRPRS
jgi:3-hydroxy-9,10-secoandrosta-1,3,5(10)-triene-9,17-dione monooxygenase